MLPIRRHTTTSPRLHVKLVSQPSLRRSHAFTTLMVTSSIRRCCCDVSRLARPTEPFAQSSTSQFNQPDLAISCEKRLLHRLPPQRRTPPPPPSKQRVHCPSPLLQPDWSTNKARKANEMLCLFAHVIRGCFALSKRGTSELCLASLVCYPIHVSSERAHCARQEIQQYLRYYVSATCPPSADTIDDRWSKRASSSAITSLLIHDSESSTTQESHPATASCAVIIHRRLC